MADILGLIKKFGLKGDSLGEEDDLTKYGKNLKELALLDTLDKEYGEARQELKDTHQKLNEIEHTIISMDQEKKEKQQLSEQLYVEGRSFYDQDDFNRALERWHHVLELNPEHKRSLAAIQDAKEKLQKEEKERITRQSVAEKKSTEASEHFEIGKKYYREKNYEQAIEEFETALNIGGRTPEVVEYRSLADQRIKEREEHIAREKKEKEEKERLIKEHCLLANNYYRQKKYEEALQEWEKALILDTESRVLQENVRRGETAFRDYKKGLEEHAQETEEKLRKIRELQIQGLKYSREHDYEKAIEFWEQAILIDPSREDIYQDIKSAQKAYREMQRIRQENEEKEKERLKREQEREHQRHEESDRLRREREEREQERFRKEEELKARQEEERSLRLEEERKAKTEKMKAHYGRGIRFYKLQEYEKALTEWEIVISLDTQFENVAELMDQAGKRIDEVHREEDNKRKLIEEEKRRLADVERKQKEERNKKIEEIFHEGLQMAFNEQYERALEKMHHALSLNRDDRGIKDQILDIERRILEQRKKQDEERFQGEMQVKKEERRELKIRLLSEQAQMYFEDGDYQRAMEEWKKILEIDFSNQEARTWMYKAERSIKDAQRKMMEAERMRREKKETMSRLNFEAVELFNDGHYEEAIKVWSQVFDMDPINSDAKQGIIKAKQRIKEIQTREKAREMAKKLIREQESRLNYLKKTIEKGERFYIDGDYKQALLEWEKALEELKG